MWRVAALALLAGMCAADTPSPSASPTKAFAYSTTHITTGLTPITCSLSGINWAVPALSAGQSWGAGLHFNASTNLFTVDADTEYVVL